MDPDNEASRVLAIHFEQEEEVLPRILAYVEVLPTVRFLMTEAEGLGWLSSLPSTLVTRIAEIYQEDIYEQRKREWKMFRNCRTLRCGIHLHLGSEDLKELRDLMREYQSEDGIQEDRVAKMRRLSELKKENWYQHTKTVRKAYDEVLQLKGRSEVLKELYLPVF